MISRPQIQAFVGALAGKHTSRGIFIATSSFSREAIEYTQNLKDARVILTNGDEIACLMIRFKVSVMVKKTFEVPEVDENFLSPSREEVGSFLWHQ